MSDLIDRGIVLDALDKIEEEVADGYGYMYEKWRKYIAEMPTQINAESTQDLISRQAVIDLLKQMRKDGEMVPWEGKDVFARIRKLPAAQPEIVHCKDCKWFGEIGCAIEIVDDSDRPNENDFCSFAERRTDE